MGVSNNANIQQGSQIVNIRQQAGGNAGSNAMPILVLQPSAARQINAAQLQQQQQHQASQQQVPQQQSIQMGNQQPQSQIISCQIGQQPMQQHQQMAQQQIQQQHLQPQPQPPIQPQPPPAQVQSQPQSQQQQSLSQSIQQQQLQQQQPIKQMQQQANLAQSIQQSSQLQQQQQQQQQQMNQSIQQVSQLPPQVHPRHQLTPQQHQMVQQQQINHQMVPPIQQPQQPKQIQQQQQQMLQQKMQANSGPPLVNVPQQNQQRMVNVPNVRQPQPPIQVKSGPGLHSAGGSGPVSNQYSTNNHSVPPPMANSTTGHSLQPNQMGIPRQAPPMANAPMINNNSGPPSLVPINTPNQQNSVHQMPPNNSQMGTKSGMIGPVHRPPTQQQLPPPPPPPAAPQAPPGLVTSSVQSKMLPTNTNISNAVPCSVIPNQKTLANNNSQNSVPNLPGGSPQLMPSPMAKLNQSPHNQPLNTPSSIPRVLTAEDQMYQEKLQSMQKYVGPLWDAIQKSLKHNNVPGMDKMKNLYQILTGQQPGTLALLEKCEKILQSGEKILNKHSVGGVPGKLPLTTNGVQIKPFYAKNSIPLTGVKVNFNI